MQTLKRIFIVLAIIMLAAVMLIAAPPLHAHAGSLVLQPGSDTGLDTFLSSFNATTNYGTNSTITVGEKTYSQSDKRRSAIKFDLSSIPAAATINSATLTLWVQANVTTGADLIMQVHRLKRDWVEAEATWDIYSTGNNWQTAGGGGANDFDTTITGSVTVSKSTTAGTQIDITLDAAEVQKLIDGTYSNQGWMLKASSESENLFNFYSSDAANGDYHPKLAIDYTYVDVPGTQTAAYNQTQTALALTATFEYNETQTAYANQTATAYSLTLTAMGPTSTNTPTPTATATFITPGAFVGTAYLNSRVTYGDIATSTSLMCVGLLLFLLVVTGILLSTLLPKTR